MSEKKICLFAGTTEGRELAFFLAGRCALTVCVATEYGEILLDGLKGADIRAGRLAEAAMEALFEEEAFDLVADATHPYAKEVSANIRRAAAVCGCEYLRVARSLGGEVSGCVYVSSAAEAADYLADKSGNVFVSTGMKELPAFAPIPRERLFVRVLPSVASIEACERENIPPSHIIAAQGPFSAETNLANFRWAKAQWLVTKQSGRAGGFDEKLAAAGELGMDVVVIGAPADEGVSYDEAVRMLSEKLGLSSVRHVDIVGCGCGALSLLTGEAAAALRGARLIIGAPRLVDSLKARYPEKRYVSEIMPEKIKALIDAEASPRVCVVMTGDVGFYSGAKKLCAMLSAYDVGLIPGIGSAVYFAARLGVPWEDWALVSMHARACNIAARVRASAKVFLLTGGAYTPSGICDALCRCGLGEVSVTVGERLSYEDEKLTAGTAASLREASFDPLSCMLVENERPVTGVRTGLPDETFLRGDVPMTKSEVRALILSKLALSRGSVVYDIGAGTGSVSVECALSACDGTVYAVEKNPEAVTLIRKNAEKFGVPNLIPVEGTAPEAMGALPAPTHVFVGGSSGNLQEILAAVCAKNPSARIVISAVTLETVGEASAGLAALGFMDYEAVAVNVSRAKKLGGYRLMQAQNPVYLFTAEKNDENRT